MRRTPPPLDQTHDACVQTDGAEQHQCLVPGCNCAGNGPSTGSDQLKLLQYSSVDISSLPREYLDAYPYPAFVLVSGVPPLTDASASSPFPLDLPWTQTKFVSIRPFSPIWSNRSWRGLAKAKSLLECLPLDSVRRLGDWITGAQDPQVRARLAKGGQWKPDDERDNAGFAGYSGGYDPLASDSLDKVDLDCSTSPTLTLEFTFGSVKMVLELARTILPIHQVRDKERTQMSTHTFAIVTAVPRQGFDYRAKQTRARSTSRSSVATSVVEAPTEAPHSEPVGMLGNTVVEDNPGEPSRVHKRPEFKYKETGDILSSLADWTPGQPLYFFRDGTIVRQALPSRNRTADGKPYDIEGLLTSIDWSKTPLGPREQWPFNLRSILSFLVLYPLPACIWWGQDLTHLYNQRYAEKARNHPHVFGQSGTVSWAELWETLGPLSELVLSGTPVVKEDDFVLSKTYHSPRSYESYRSQMWVPLKNESGEFGGIFHGMIDTTTKVLAERRAALVREVGERSAEGRSMKDFDRAILDTLAAYPKDAPFAILYHVEPSSTSLKSPHSHGSPPQRGRLRLAGSIGVPDGHPSAPTSVCVAVPAAPGSTDLMIASAFPKLPNLPQQVPSTPSRASSLNAGASNNILGIPTTLPPMEQPADSWPFVEALKYRKPVLVSDCSAIIKGYSITVWDELPSAAVVIPIALNTGESMPGAVLVMGLSCRLSYDDDYEAFINVYDIYFCQRSDDRLRMQMAFHFAAVREYEEDQKRIQDLAALDRAKSLLFSNVSHELFTPLTLISGPLDDVLEDLEDGSQRELLTVARRNVYRLTRLVTMLMDVSGLEAGRMRGKFTQVNLGALTRDIAGLFRKTSELAKLDYHVECDETQQDTYVNRETWEKILFTLIGNAIKYTATGHVRVSLEYATAEAVFTVEDTGVGIPADDLRLLGESYYQDQSIHHMHDGTGIALSFTNKLIQMHNGRLEAESKTARESNDGSHGSIFRVYIPLGSRHLAPDAVHHGQGEDSDEDATSLKQFRQSILQEIANCRWNGEEPGSNDPTLEFKPNSRGIDPNTLYFKPDDVVMVVDDLPDTRRYMASIFEPFCTIVEVCDGVEALAKYNERRPDLIIADVMLKRMNGFELLKALRTGSRDQHIVPVILLTALDDARADGLLGADDYLPKPFNAREIVARAHMQLQLGKKRRALETAFEERTNELRMVTDHSPVGIFRCTPEGYVSYANSAWHELSGYPVGEKVMNWGDYVAADHQERIRNIWNTFVPSGEPDVGAEWMWKNGRWVSTKVLRLDAIAGAPPCMIGCSIDITERKLNEQLQRQRVEEAEQRRAEAEEAKYQQELLIDITSHEIRNPLSSLMQYCASLVKSNMLCLQEELQRARDEDRSFKPTTQLLLTMNEDLEALDSIYQCGLTQERISNDVLSLGKIQLDKMQMFDIATDIRKEAQKLISIFQNEARMQSLTLSLEVSEEFDRLGIKTIMTDPVRLGQVVTNLLSNAVRFTSNSAVRRVELRLDVGLEPPEENCVKPTPIRQTRAPVLTSLTPLYLYVTVSDTGRGLNPEELEVLFQRFSQASPKTHTVFGGSGLGLFVCRKITELMGGGITVNSEFGKGSEFTFCIKTRPHLGKAGSINPRVPTSHEAHKLHVLIVEDNHINRTVLRRQLQHVGLTCELASNGLEALQAIQKVWRSEKGAQPFDCVLMDLEMPVMDGYTATRKIREEEDCNGLRPLRIIALTGNARQAQIRSAMKDFSEVVIKPYRLDDLLCKLEPPRYAASNGHEQEREENGALATGEENDKRNTNGRASPKDLEATPWSASVMLPNHT